MDKSKPCSVRSVFQENVLMHERLMDAEAIQSATASRLPQRARWLIGDNTTLDFSLYNEPRSLAAEFVKWGLSEADVADIEHGPVLIVFCICNFTSHRAPPPALSVLHNTAVV